MTLYAAEAMTFDSLMEDLKQYAERQDEPFLAQRARFVMMAENRIASDPKIRGLGLMRFAATTLTQGTPTYAKPSRWRETVSFSYINSSNKRIYLKERAYEYCRVYWPTVATQAAPVYYANYDFENFIVVGTPDAAYAAEFCYYERPAPLSSANQVNWLTQYAPQLLLYGCLLEAQPFLKRPERIAEFRAFYDEAVANVSGEAKRRAQDQSQSRTEA